MDERTSERNSEDTGERERALPSTTATQLVGSAPADVRDVSFHMAVRGYDRREVDRYVQHVNRVIAELEITRSPESAVRHALDRVGEQTSGILQRARETAHEIIHAARSEAEDTVARGAAQAREVVADARVEADRIVAEADGDARELREEGARELTAARDQWAKRAPRPRRRWQEPERAKSIGSSSCREQAERELLALRADTDAVAQQRRRVVEEVHELAAELEAVADAAGGAAAAATLSGAIE